MREGWIYILVNSSMPGLAKVGRTERRPCERVAELSAATGVATPFVLAFEQSFSDCVAAECAVHTELERRGLRVAANREFFRGSPADIVRVVLDAAAAAGGARVSPKVRPAGHLLAEADRHLFGTGETLQDLAEAARCYQLAASRGSLVALERLGAIYAETRAGTPAGRRRALRYLKSGAARGNYYCYCEMARLFAGEGHCENFVKAWALFFARRADSRLEEVEGELRYIIALRSYIDASLRLRRAPIHMGELRNAADALMEHLAAKLEAPCSVADRAWLAPVLRWCYHHLLPREQETPSRRRPRRWLSDWAAALGNEAVLF